MFDLLSQVLFAIVRTLFQAAMNIFLYSVLSRIFTRWLGLHGVISFLCELLREENSLFYPTCAIINSIEEENNGGKNFSQSTLLVISQEVAVIARFSQLFIHTTEFESDWEYLIKNDRKHILTSIIDIPFHRGWLFFVIIVAIDYQINNSDTNYLLSLFRTIAIIILLISGAAIRYQTLFERDREKCMDLIKANPDEFERYIAYSQNTIPIASVCLERKETEKNVIFLVQLCQLDSRFNDYFYNIADFTCRNLIERVKISVRENQKSIRLIWSLPTCQKSWTYAIKNNKFVLNNTYQDFSFMPFVHSYVEQYEYAELGGEITEEKKDQ